MRSFPILALALLLAGCAAQEPATTERALEPGAPGDPRENTFLLGTPMPMSATLREGAEPTILADREGPELFIAYHSGGVRSPDGGRTWTTMSDPFTLPFDGWGLAQDDAGSLYAAVNERAVVEVFRSTDDGRSWRSGPAFPALRGIADASAYADRAWLAARGQGEVMVIYWAVGTSLEEACVRSTDGAATWPDRDPMFGPPLGGRPVFGDDGTFAYVSEGTLHRYSDVDAAGSRCRAPRDATPLFPGQGRVTMTDVDFENGTYFSAAPTAGNRGVQLAGVGGASATPRLLTIPTAPLASHVMPALSAHGDEVAIAWYATETAGDFQDPAFPGWWNVYVARVRGFWSEAPEVTLTRLTTEANHRGSICLGGISCGSGSDRDLLDYLGIDHDRTGALHVAYTHDGTSERSFIRYAKLP